MRFILLLVMALAVAAPVTAFAEAKAETAAQADGEAQKGNKKVKYKSGKDVNFEELLIQGQLKRPDVTVVTGDDGMGTDGLLRLRQNFLDRVAQDAGGAGGEATP